MEEFSVWSSIICMNSPQINLLASISAEGDNRRQIDNLYNVNEGVITVSWTAPNSRNLPCLEAPIRAGITLSDQSTGQRLQKLLLKISCDYRWLMVLKWRKSAEEGTIRNLTLSHMQEVEVLRKKSTAKSTTFSVKWHQPLSKEGLNTGLFLSWPSVPFSLHTDFVIAFSSASTCCAAQWVQASHLTSLFSLTSSMFPFPLPIAA